jgi:hypothetical protein
MMDERLTDLERQFCEVNDLRVQHFADLMKVQAENARLHARLEVSQRQTEAAEIEIVRLHAQLEAVRGAAQVCADSVVTTMGVFDDGEEEEMLIVPPNTLEALRLALSNEGGDDG